MERRAYRRLKAFTKGRGLLLWFAIAAFLLLFISLISVDPDNFEYGNTNKNIIREVGFVGYLAIEVSSTISDWLEERSLAFKDASPYREFLQASRKTSPPAGTGKLTAKNIIYIQMESVDAISVEATFAGEPVMPFLHKLRKNCTHFLNTFDNTAAGRTSDGEFLVLASLPPVSRKPVFRNYNLSSVPSLPRVLNKAGYYTFSMHGFRGSFWNRRTAHAQLGFAQSFFVDDLEQSDMIGWGISDKSLLSQAADKIRGIQKPFFAHLILLTNHHPYQHVAKLQNLPTGNIVEDHITSLRYVDRAIEAFFTRLEEDGVLDNSIVAIFGDHDSGITDELREKVTLERKFAGRDTVPLLIYGLEEAPREIQKITGLQDLPVIVLDELGLKIPHTFSGHPLNSKQPMLYHTPRLVWLENGTVRNAKSGIQPALLTKLAIMYPEKLEPSK